MKKMITMMMMMVLLAIPSFAQDKAIRVEVDNMIPQKFPTRVVNGGYYIALQNDSVDLYLPYIGETYMPVLNNDGLNFYEPVKNLKVTVKEKKSGTRTDTNFEVFHNGMNYIVNLTTWGEGTNAQLTVRPNNGSACNYSGPQVAPKAHR